MVYRVGAIVVVQLVAMQLDVATPCPQVDAQVTSPAPPLGLAHMLVRLQLLLCIPWLVVARLKNGRHPVPFPQRTMQNLLTIHLQHASPLILCNKRGEMCITLLSNRIDLT